MVGLGRAEVPPAMERSQLSSEEGRRSGEVMVLGVQKGVRKRVRKVGEGELGEQGGHGGNHKGTLEGAGTPLDFSSKPRSREHPEGALEGGLRPAFPTIGKDRGAASTNLRPGPACPRFPLLPYQREEYPAE